MLSTRPTATARRLGALVAPAVAGALILASCGGESAATQSTIDLSQASTAFVVRPPASTVPTADGASVITGSQEYVIQAGDYPLLLVDRFGITLDDLIAINEWGSVNEFPGPGTTILIPPGATSIDEAAAESTETDTETDTDTDTETAPAATIPDAGDNCGEGSYPIEEGDTTRLGVAEKFDVTVEALDAANANTPGYSAFYPGLEIVIPAKDDC